MEEKGRIVSLTGGRYLVEGRTGRVLCVARGSFRSQGLSPLVGDEVLFQKEEDDTEAKGVITAVEKRKNELIRPPLSNLDTLFLVCAVKDPEPVLQTLDKLLSIAVHNDILPVPVFTKRDLDPVRAEELTELYRKAGFDAVAVSSLDSESAKSAIFPLMRGTICAVAGASGVGKSSLLNALFPDLGAETGDLSRKTHRGRHTTRQCTLYDVSARLGRDGVCYMADTPGFSLLDFEKFFFMEREDLPFSFPEFVPHLGECKYTKCSHRTEEGCRILQEVTSGKIAKSRHESYAALWEELARTPKWETGKKKTKK